MEAAQAKATELAAASKDKGAELAAGAAEKGAELVAASKAAEVAAGTKVRSGGGERCLCGRAERELEIERRAEAFDDIRPACCF